VIDQRSDLEQAVSGLGDGLVRLDADGDAVPLCYPQDTLQRVSHHWPDLVIAIHSGR